MQWKQSQRVCEYFQLFFLNCRVQNMMMYLLKKTTAKPYCTCSIKPSACVLHSWRKCSGSNKMHAVYHCYNNPDRQLWCYHKYKRMTMLQRHLIMLTCWLWKGRWKPIYNWQLPFSLFHPLFPMFWYLTSYNFDLSQYFGLLFHTLDFKSQHLDLPWVFLHFLSLTIMYLMQYNVVECKTTQISLVK